MRERERERGREGEREGGRKGGRGRGGGQVLYEKWAIFKYSTIEGNIQAVKRKDNMYANSYVEQKSRRG